MILNKTEKLDEILIEFVHNNIQDATAIESPGMAQLLSNNHDDDEIPFLRFLKVLLHLEREKNNFIFTDHQLEKCVCE